MTQEPSGANEDRKRQLKAECVLGSMSGGSWESRRAQTGPRSKPGGKRRLLRPVSLAAPRLGRSGRSFPFRCRRAPLTGGSWDWLQGEIAEPSCTCRFSGVFALRFAVSILSPVALSSLTALLLSESRVCTVRKVLLTLQTSFSFPYGTVAAITCYSHPFNA